nr:hypothetical protein Itr_chr12CG18720 [Ipomoea trifida]
MARRAEGEKAGGSGRSNYNYSSQRPSEYGAGFEASSNPITLYRYYPQQAPLVCFNPAASVTEEVVFTGYEAAQLPPYEAKLYSAMCR